MVDIELYGGRRGIIEHFRARALYALGAYQRAGDIEWSSVGRLVFICKGNICRSPYACARARALDVQAVSFGLDATDGALADRNELKNALLRGIDLSMHRSSRLESAHLAGDDLVIVFEPGQVAEVRRRFGDRPPVRLLGIWTRPSRPHIQDPYGRSDRYFQQCFSVIDANVAELVARMTRGDAPATRGVQSGSSLSECQQ